MGFADSILTSKQMTFQMLRMKISLIAVRAREFAIGILGRNGRVLRATIDAIRDRSRAARNTRENAPSALRSNHLGPRRLLGVRAGTIRSSHGIRVHPSGRLAI